MARLVYEENMKVWSVPSIADRSAPTVAEIEAGTEVTDYLTKNGFNLTSSQNMVSGGDLGSTFIDNVPGSHSYTLALTFYRDPDDDVPWDTFVRGYETNWVVAPFGFSGVDGAPAATDKVQVIPYVCGEPQVGTPAQDTQQTFTIQGGIWADPDMRAEVAAA